MFQFCDGADHYADTTRLLEKWATYYTNGFTLSINTTGGRRSGGCLQGNNGQVQVTAPIVNSPTEVIAHVAFYVAALSANTCWLVRAFEGATGHIGLRVVGTGAINVYRNSEGATVLLGSTSGGLVTAGTWNHFQVRIKLHATLGEVEIRKNGAEAADYLLENQNTIAGGSGVVNGIVFGGLNNVNTTYRYDDILIVDTVDTGDGFDTFMGDVAVVYHAPDGAGDAAEFTRSGADSGANWSQVDEAAASGDTDAVEATAIGTKDLYTLENLKLPGQVILGVVPVVEAKKTEPGTAALDTIFRHSATNYPPASGQVAGTSYLFLQRLYPTNPGTGLPWTESDFNALQAGPYKTA